MELKEKYKKYLEDLKYSKNTIKLYLFYFDKLSYNMISNKLTEPVIVSFLKKYNVNNAIAFLKSFSRFMKFDYNILDRIIKTYKSRGRQKIKTDYITIEDYHDILNYENRLRYKVILRLMFELGLRVSEVSNIKRENINFRLNYIEGIGKGNKYFKLYFSNSLRNDLLKYVRSRGKKKLFPSAVAIWKRIKKLGREVLDRDLHPHMLRHGFCMFLVDKFSNIKELQAAMRHSNINSTMRYIHIKDVESVKKKVVELFEDN